MEHAIINLLERKILALPTPFLSALAKVKLIFSHFHLLTLSFFFLTILGVAYVNESTGEAVLEGRPNPRTVSQALLKVDDAGIDASSKNGISLLTVFMGQFIGWDKWVFFLFSHSIFSAHDLAITIDSDDPDDRVDIEIEDDNDPLLFFSKKKKD